MSQFWLYFQLGLEHVLDWNAYDHILFLIVLVASYSFSSWKRVLWLVTIFTLGHTLALFLSVYEIVIVSSKWVEALIAVTIFVTALYNILTAKKKESQKNISLLYFATAFFGIIHGLGFSTYFKMISSNTQSKFLPLLEFALGIEAAQVIVVLVVLVLAFICQNFFRINKRDWVLVLSSIVIGIILPILKENIQAFF
ncbi:HupE/UreJ family protein [Antarcticibacterium sp. 1MA-6-2]|uniref:HupE/UreJ family protein n=1 Tax=Antarcticibacterium sp. 1MA-6-2 TaxID=2908210 RepID=UPI001F48203C|nr:HupE/UreJ family protein [Antarcticibacterium sp. 1MA-6-2]UJH90376.1 HupE/UreJ family protein [Antarcticibacterium sp. 1MA-6-2]